MHTGCEQAVLLGVCMSCAGNSLSPLRKRGDSGTVIGHPFLYEVPVVLAPNEFSLLSKVSTKLIQWEQITIIAIKGEKV